MNPLFKTAITVAIASLTSSIYADSFTGGSRSPSECIKTTFVCKTEGGLNFSIKTTGDVRNCFEKVSINGVDVTSQIEERSFDRIFANAKTVRIPLNTDSKVGVPNDLDFSIDAISNISIGFTVRNILITPTKVGKGAEIILDYKNDKSRGQRRSSEFSVRDSGKCY